MKEDPILAIRRVLIEAFAHVAIRVPNGATELPMVEIRPCEGDRADRPLPTFLGQIDWGALTIMSTRGRDVVDLGDMMYLLVRRENDRYFSYCLRLYDLNREDYLNSDVVLYIPEDTPGNFGTWRINADRLANNPNLHVQFHAALPLKYPQDTGLINGVLFELVRQAYSHYKPINASRKLQGAGVYETLRQ